MPIEIVTFEEFINRTLGGRPNSMNTKYYVGASFDCGCGESHVYSLETVRILRELPKMRLVVKPTDCNYVNCVKVKGILYFRGFNTLFATEDE